MSENELPGLPPSSSEPVLPPAPTLARSLRTALSDFLGQSWRLVIANLAWGFGLLMLLAAAAITPLGWVLTPLLALPAAGVFRLAALIVRDEPVSLSQAFGALRRIGGRALLVGTALVAGVAVLGTNLVVGLEARGLVGWSLATFAGWGLAALGVLAVTIWPLLVDPRRDGMSLSGVLRLAALLALAYPLRFGALALVVVAIVALSTLAVVALLTLALGFAALVGCRYVLPAADRFAARIPALPAPDPVSPPPAAHVLPRDQGMRDPR
jgi:hypothetical protein